MHFAFIGGRGRHCSFIRWLLLSHHRVSHLLVDLGWIDFDLGVPPSCLAASAKFPLAHAEPGRQVNTQNQSQPNPVHEQMGVWDTMYGSY